MGVGRGADHRAFDLQLSKGEHTIVALLDNLGRFSEGNDLGERKGLFGHLYEVKRLGAVKPKRAVAAAVDPFSLRGYIAGRTFGQLSDTEQVVWTFVHPRKTAILVEIDGAAASGTLVLNDKPLLYYAGATGACLQRVLLRQGKDGGLRRGKNVLRFAPDPRQEGAADQLARATSLYECVEELSGSASWAFAKWETPLAAAYQPVSQAAARSLRRTPCWWRTSFVGREASGPMRLDLSTLSKGQAFINGRNLGRYFSATPDGRPVGAQRLLYVPASWVNPDEANEVLLFDEHGFSPHRARIVFGETDEEGARLRK